MDPDIHKESMRMLGAIIVDWAFCEHVLEDIISGMLGAEIRAVNALTANMNVISQIRSAKGIGKMRFDDAVYAQFEGVLGPFETMVPFRNKLVHGFWAEDEENNFRVALVKSTGTLKTQAEYINLQYLVWLFREVRRCLSLMIAFGEEHGLLDWSNTDASPDTPSTLDEIAGPDPA